MDSRELSSQQIILGLAALSAIPVVLFALWADYFARYLEAARKTSPRFDPKLERDRVRIAAGSVLIFEAVLFLGSLDVLGMYPKEAGTLIIACVLAVGWVQAGMEKKLQPKSLTPGAVPLRPFGTSARALFFGLVSGILYVVTLMSFVKTAVWIATALHFNAIWGPSFVMFAAAAGILTGIGINFALAPWQLKSSLKLTKMDEELAAPVRETMARAGLQDFEYWIVEEPQATAAIAGFSRGRGVFRPALFISRKVIASMTLSELNAVVAHEAAHVLAKHLRKRVLLSAALITALTFVAVFCTVASVLWLPKSEMQGSTGLFFGVFGFFSAFFVLQRQSRVHEFQADWLAVQKLGADFESWASALRKMDQLNGYPVSRGAVSSHPRTEIRIQNVARMIEFFSTLKKAEQAGDKRGDRAA